MADFYQTGCVTTLHRLKPGCAARMENELREMARHVSIALVLPALYSEFESPAMRRIADELADVPYLRHIVVVLARAGIDEYRRVQQFFADFPQKITVLWIDSPEVQNLLEILQARGLSAGPDGKGRSCWLAYGYLLATGDCDVARVCQVDLAETYEHKHQAISKDDPSTGLRRMTCEVAKSLLRTLAGEGLVFTKDQFRSLQVRYVRMAEDTIGRYYADAMLNGLEFDRNEEEAAVAAFAESLRQATQEFVEAPLGNQQIPNWNRVLAAIPEFLGLLRDSAVAVMPKVQSYAYRNQSA